MALGLQLLLELKVQLHNGMTVKHADDLARARHTVQLGSKLIVDVGAEAVKVVLAVTLGNEGAYLQRLKVFQQDDRGGNGRSGLSKDGAFNGSGISSAGLSYNGRLRLRVPG